MTLWTYTTLTDSAQGIRMALFGLALAESRLGHLVSARSNANEGLAICREIGDRFFSSYFLWILALVETDAGNIEVARSHAEDSLHIAEELEVPLLLVCALEASASVALREADLERAWQLLTRADDIAESGTVPSSYGATVARAASTSSDRSRSPRASAIGGESIGLSRASRDPRRTIGVILPFTA